MSSVKVKFRPSTINGKEGTIYYQIIKSRVIRQLKTDYRLFSYEWDISAESISFTGSVRPDYLKSIEESIGWNVRRLQAIINQLENNRVRYTADDVIAIFHKQANKLSLFNFMQIVITQLHQMGRQRTSETYRCTLKSFMQFREDKDRLLEDIDSDLMQVYEAYLRNRGLRKNTTSFYMRILRAVYNRAVEKSLTVNRNPFKYVYTGIDKTLKRAIPLKAIRQIKNLDLSLQPSLDFARDIDKNLGCAVVVYGKAELNNCVLKGSTQSDYIASHYPEYADFPIYDMACTNSSHTYINGGEVGTIFGWEQAKYTIGGGAKIGKLYTIGVSANNLSHVEVNDATVDHLIFDPSGKYDPSVTLNAGAVVKVLEFVGVDVWSAVVINDGATVEKVVVDGEEMTLEQFIAQYK